MPQRLVGDLHEFAASGCIFNSYNSCDDNGDITHFPDDTHTTTYAYDSANQLIRENNEAGNFTHVWTYDNAGNILSRTEYVYTDGELGTTTDTVNYTYDDTSWGDLLTAYDGQSFTYDTIGNLTDDGTWDYTWQHSRPANATIFLSHYVGRKDLKSAIKETPICTGMGSHPRTIKGPFRVEVSGKTD